MNHNNKKNSKSETIYYIAAIILIVVIIFSQINPVGGKRICKNGGYRNSTDGECSCDMQHYGPNCEYS